MPFSAAPIKMEKSGSLIFGSGNRIGRLDPNTGEVEEFVAPNKGTAGIHSAVPAPGGSVWLAEQSVQQSWKVGSEDAVDHRIIRIRINLEWRGLRMAAPSTQSALITRKSVGALPSSTT